MNVEQLAKQHFEEGRRVPASSTELHRNHKIGGDYYVRAYSRAFNRLVKAAAETAKQEFVSENKGLVEMLFEQTQILKIEYLEKVADWARAEFARFEARVAAPYPVYDDFRDGTPMNYKGGKEYRKALDARYAAQRIVEAGLDAFLAREEKLAVAHYENSIVKLAARIEKKGLNQEAIAIKTARVGVNIETVLSDGNKSVRAFTIVASGCVQRPHYRYLIK